MKKIKFIFISLFPEKIKSFLDYSIIKKPIERGEVIIDFINLRNFGKNKQKQVDDFQYGPGRGMVLMIEPLYEAIQEAKKRIEGAYQVILLTPQGEIWKQERIAPLLSKYTNFIFVAGNYEGFDERIRAYVDCEWSIGDYVLSGGELPALVIANSLIRMLPNTIREESKTEDSFTKGRLDYPVYTKPLIFKNQKVPEILLSGHHENIKKWRKKTALYKTWKRRSDLLKTIVPTTEETKLIKEFINEAKNKFK